MGKGSWGKAIKVRKENDEIKGYIIDINTRRTVASHLFHRSVNGYGVLLELGYEGIQRVAARCSFLSHYLKYHTVHINALSALTMSKENDI